MTLKSSPNTAAVTSQTLEQHLQQADRHLQQAVVSRLEAAKSHGVGDTKAATAQAQTASDHTAHAQQHVLQAEKLLTPSATGR